MMKNKPLFFMAITVFVCLLTACTGKQKATQKIDTISEEEYKNLTQQESPLDAKYVKEVLSKPTIRHRETLKDYEFKLPFNYRIRFVPVENKPGNYFKFQWKINDNFIIDSEAKDFKHFTVSNFIPYMPQGSGEGDFFFAKSKNATRLTIKDFLATADEVFYSDENSAIFKIRGGLKAFYFEYLPKTDEYLIYLSDTPFINKRPEVTKAEEVDQLLSQVRMAKNIFKPINNPSKTWNNYKNQLTILEKGFFEGIKVQSKDKLKEQNGNGSYSPADQGNIKYYTVFENGKEINATWEKLSSINKMATLVVTDDDNNYRYLRDNDFRFFYTSNYKQIERNKLSRVFERIAKNAFCLITKTNSNKFILLKEFPALYDMPEDYYKNEIDFYRALFEDFD